MGQAKRKAKTRGEPKYAAHGPGFSGQTEIRDEAQGWVVTNACGAVYVRADLLDALLKAAKAAAERMRGDGYGLYPNAVGAKELRDLEAAIAAAEGE
jgi:hypothetical protein